MKKTKGQGKRKKVQGRGQKARVKGQEVQGNREKIPGKGRACVGVAARRLPRVPPPDSEIWPQEYRGKRWRPSYAKRFAGKCQLCAYSCPLTEFRQLLDAYIGIPRLLHCTNHPSSPGALREVLPTGTCRNFKAVSGQTRRSSPVMGLRTPASDASDPSVRRIPLGHGLFATVDAADYEMLSKYKWYAFRPTPNRAYAACHTKGKTVFMHRMIMRPRKGYVVDHIDGNGVNNRRCNLRICTPAQNRANAGPRGGTSRFVGVSRRKDKWEAGISCRGTYHRAGFFEDEVEAAKARDRLAYALHGPYAYLNFPEDFPP